MFYKCDIWMKNQSPFNLYLATLALVILDMLVFLQYLTAQIRILNRMMQFIYHISTSNISTLKCINAFLYIGMYWNLKPHKSYTYKNQLNRISILEASICLISTFTSSFLHFKTVSLLISAYTPVLLKLTSSDTSSR